MSETQATVQKDSVVAMHYVLRDEEGSVIDQSEAGKPLPYLHGYRNIVPGLEAALTGASVGETKQVVVPPEEGYGIRDEKLVLSVTPDQLPDDLSPQVGMTLGMQTPEGQTVPVRVAEVESDQIRLDANHQLAGVTLHFEVTIDSVRAATEEELSHGHAHGPDDHAH